MDRDPKEIVPPEPQASANTQTVIAPVEKSTDEYPKFLEAELDDGMIFGVEKGEQMKLAYLGYVKTKNEQTGEDTFIAATKPFLTDIPFLEVVSPLIAFLKNTHQKMKPLLKPIPRKIETTTKSDNYKAEEPENPHTPHQIPFPKNPGPNPIPSPQIPTIASKSHATEMVEKIAETASNKPPFESLEDGEPTQSPELMGNMPIDDQGKAQEEEPDRWMQEVERRRVKRRMKQYRHRARKRQLASGEAGGPFEVNWPVPVQPIPEPQYDIHRPNPIPNERAWWPDPPGITLTSRRRSTATVTSEAQMEEIPIQPPSAWHLTPPSFRPCNGVPHCCDCERCVMWRNGQNPV
jgi:hypothetical protein